jgi:hypothetical protein
MLVRFAFGRTASSGAGYWTGPRFSAFVTMNFPRIVTTALRSAASRRNSRDPSPHLAPHRFLTIHFSRIVTPSNIHMKTSHLPAIAELAPDRHNRAPTTQPLTETAAVQAPISRPSQFVTIHFSRIVTPSNIHMKTSHLPPIAEFSPDRHNRAPQRSLSPKQPRSKPPSRDLPMD